MSLRGATGDVAISEMQMRLLRFARNDTEIDESEVAPLRWVFESGFTDWGFELFMFVMLPYQIASLKVSRMLDTWHTYR